MPSQSDNAIQFSFDGGNSPSEADLQAAVSNSENPDYTAPAQVDKPVTQEAKVETTPAEVKPAADITTSAQPATEDLKTYTIKVNGEEMTVTEADLKAGHMRHRDYTQKTQQLAEQTKAWESERLQYQQALQNLDSFLQDPAAIDAYRQKVFGVTPESQRMQPPVIDQTQPLSVQDVARISAYNAEQVRLSMAQEYEAKLREVSQSAHTAAQKVSSDIQREKLTNEIDAHVSGLLKQYPLLSKFEDITEDLMGDASKRLGNNPTIADAKAQLTAAAERRIAVIKAIAEDEKKTSAIQAAKLKQGSIEPPGGKALTTPQGRKLTLNSGDRKDFLASATADLQAFVDANS